MKRVLGYGLTALILGCGAGDMNDDERESNAPSKGARDPGASTTPTAQRDVGPGAAGREVQEVYQYLARYGYFPSDELAKKYPGFRPLVDRTPADTSLFGAELAEAVRSYQSNMGLEVTGIVDANTRATMTALRCDHPDGHIEGPEGDVDPDAPPTAAFDVRADLARTGYTWMIGASSWIPGGFTRATLGDYFDNLIYAKWRQYFDAPLTRVSSGSNQVVNFQAWDGASADSNGDGFCDTGCNAGMWGNNVLRFDAAEPWAYTTWPTGSQFDLQTAALHEVGHSIGIDHSADSLSIMYPTISKGVSRRYLTHDDIQAVRAGRSKWGAANGSTGMGDAAQSPSHIWGLISGTGGVAFCSISSPGICLPAGFAAVSFAADSRDRIWAVASTGLIYYARLGSTSWTQIGGGACAREIGINALGTVFVRGCDDRLHYGRMNANITDTELFNQRNNGFIFQGPGTNGVSPFFMSISPGNGGAPWAWGVDYDGVPWYYVAPGGWTSLDTLITSNTRVKTIASTGDGAAVWAVSFDGTKVLALNLQNQVLKHDGSVGASLRKRWITSLSGATSLQRARVGLDGRPFITQSGGPLRSTTK
jgi:hypothetical protein